MGAPKNDFSVCEADDLAPSVNVTTQFTPGASVAVVGLKYHSLSHIYGVGQYHKHLPSPISLFISTSTTAAPPRGHEDREN